MCIVAQSELMKGIARRSAHAGPDPRPPMTPPERREDFALDMRRNGVREELITVRLRSDVSQRRAGDRRGNVDLTRPLPAAATPSAPSPAGAPTHAGGSAASPAETIRRRISSLARP